MANHIQ